MWCKLKNMLHLSPYLVLVYYWALDKCLWFVPCRDDYDKEVKQAKELQRRRHTTTPRRPRRPDIQVYHPRSRRESHKACCSAPNKATKCWGGVCFPDGSEPGGTAEAEEWNESGSSTEAETQAVELFWLDYQADSGDITSFIVHKVKRTFKAVIFFTFDSFSWIWILFSWCLQGDNPEKIVERVAENNALDSAMRAALEARIQKEIDKRLKKRWFLF